MREKIIEILNDTRPEFDFGKEESGFIDKGMLDSFDIISLVSDLEEEMGFQFQETKFFQKILVQFQLLKHY